MGGGGRGVNGIGNFFWFYRTLTSQYLILFILILIYLNLRSFRWSEKNVGKLTPPPPPPPTPPLCRFSSRRQTLSLSKKLQSDFWFIPTSPRQIYKNRETIDRNYNPGKITLSFSLFLILTFVLKKFSKFRNPELPVDLFNI